jgi:hypothetical protein
MSARRDSKTIAHKGKYEPPRSYNPGGREPRHTDQAKTSNSARMIAGVPKRHLKRDMARSAIPAAILMRPSVSVMARVPIAGISKNVVVSVPMIEPAVETP